jgi:hypothetical protein
MGEETHNNNSIQFNSYLFTCKLNNNNNYNNNNSIFNSSTAQKPVLIKSEARGQTKQTRTHKDKTRHCGFRNFHLSNAGHFR